MTAPPTTPPTTTLERSGPTAPSTMQSADAHRYLANDAGAGQVLLVPDAVLVEGMAS